MIFAATTCIRPIVKKKITLIPKQFNFSCFNSIENENFFHTPVQKFVRMQIQSRIHEYEISLSKDEK